MKKQRYYRDVKIGELLSLLAKDYPDNEALVYPDRGLRYSFHQLAEVVRCTAKGLLKLGLQRGDRVALWATNEPEWIILQFALAKMGAVLVTVNTSLRAAELAYLLKQSQALAIVTIKGFRDVSYLDEIYQILPELKQTDVQPFNSPTLPFLRYTILIDNETAPGFINFSKLAELAAEVSDRELDAREASLDINDLINMQYTSGTTGFPKGVMLSHRNIVNNGYWLGEAMAYTSQDRLCLPVPLFHCFGCVIGVLGAYTHAVCLVPLEYFEARRVLSFVERERCTALYGVPTMFIAELEDGEFSRFDLSTLRKGIMAGALCPEPLMRRVIDEMNLKEMLIAYGLTESSPGITHTLRDDSIERRTQTVGKVMPEQEVKIIDPLTLEELPLNRPGELIVRGYNVMLGYYNNEAATKEAMINFAGEGGWLRTGDQATMDEAGYIRITGRIKEIIIRGGENISPKEVEDLLRSFEKVADVYVYSIPSEKYGEAVAAAIRLKPATISSSEEIINFCYGKISKFKIPQHIRFLEQFPVTASGKVQRYRLREMHLAEISKGVE